MEFQDELAGGVVLVRPALQSPNYVAGTSGWQIAINGSAEFNDVVVRGTLRSNNYVAGTSGWQLDQAGTAEINQLTARGTLRSNTYVAGTSGWQLDQAGTAEINQLTARGTLRSNTYVAGTSGWQLDQAGTAEINQLTARGTLRSSNYAAGSAGWQISNTGAAELNQLTARGTVQSSNYVAGTSGWRVDNSGSAEFNSVTLRGGTSIGGSALYYNGTPALGSLLLSITAAPGTDAYGNAYPGGLSVYGSDGTLNALGSELSVTGTNGSIVDIYTIGTGQATVALTPRHLLGTTWDPATIDTSLNASNRPGLEISSPDAFANPYQSSISLIGGGPTTSDTSILFGADTANFSDNLTVSGELSAANIQSGSVLITPTVASEWTANVNVVFPTAFTTTPDVQITCTAGGPGSATTTLLEMVASAVSTTGVAIRIRRGNLTPTTISWLAISTP